MTNLEQEAESARTKVNNYFDKVTLTPVTSNQYADDSTEERHDAIQQQ